MSSPKETVFVVDDDDGMLKSVRWLLESEGYDVDTFSNAQDFLDAYHESRCGCLLLDLRMPGMNGLELHRRLLHDRIDIPTIIVTAHGEVPLAVAAMKEGVIDFLEKPYHDEDLLQCVRKGLELDRRHRQERAHQSGLLAKLSQLTQRERDVMRLVVQGKVNKMIAAELGISQKTVEHHRARVMQKLEIDSVAELVRIATAAENAQGHDPS